MSLADIFKAYDIRGAVPDELNQDAAHRVGKAFADWLPQPGAIAVGRDMRPDSAELTDSLIEGLLEQGRDVWDIGLVTSEMSYFAVGKYELAGSAMVTASHNPGKDNGIKLYRDQVRPVGLDSGLDKVRDAAMANKFKKSPSTGSIMQKDIDEDWITHVLSFVDTTKWPNYRIAIDVGNGMAGAILPKLQPKLPIEVTELFYELDGTFPNHHPNPHIPKNLADLIDAVRSKKLDFGIAFDGDGDRIVLVDDQARPVSGSDAITIAARSYLERLPGSEIIFEVRTSRSTRELIEKWGGKPVRVKAGRTNIGTALRERDAPFGGETTGHLFFKENYFADAGLIAALHLIDCIAKSGKKLSQLVDEYHLYAMPPEINFEVANKQAVIKKVAAEFKDGKQDWLDGLTVEYPDWWFNLRPSNTEPLLRLNIEAKDEGLLKAKIEQLQQLISG